MKQILKNVMPIVVGILLMSGCAKTSQEKLEPKSTTDDYPKKIKTLMSGNDYVFMTYNIRQDAPDAGDRNWSVRRNLIKERINTHNADIIGVQEAKGNQINDMEADLPEFWRIGTGRDGNWTSEHSSIFYRTSRFKALASGTFWLSPSAPTVATGPSWDAAYRRICTWAQFQDKVTSLKFWVFNTHFDHKGSVARENSASLILSQMQAKIGGQPAILMGDLNATQTSSCYGILNNSPLLEESWDVAGTKSPTLRATHNGWNISPNGNDQIDHIFVTKEWTVNSRLVDWYYKTPGNIVPSDHWPVITQMKIDGVTFFQDAHYGGGVSQILPLGSYNLDHLIARGMPNDWASSVKVSPGYKAIIYTDDNFSGTSWTVTSDTPLLSALSPTANDQVSSVKIMKIDGVTFFQDAHYGGSGSQTLTVGSYNLSQLIAKGMPNDWASSVKVTPGRKVIMYANDNFSGTSWTVTSDTPLLSALSTTANDQVSSLKVE